MMPVSIDHQRAIRSLNASTAFCWRKLSRSRCQRFSNARSSTTSSADGSSGHAIGRQWWEIAGVMAAGTYCAHRRQRTSYDADGAMMKSSSIVALVCLSLFACAVDGGDELGASETQASGDGDGDPGDGDGDPSGDGDGD